MAHVVADRVKETSTTTGTGTYTLAGAPTGWQSFAAIGNGNTTFYCAVMGADWEVGIGTYTASGTTLARTTVLKSSNSNNAVSWGAGTKEIACVDPAARSFWNLAAGLFKTNAAGQLTAVPLSSFVETLLDDTTAGAFLTTLGISAFVQTILDDSDAATARSTLGLGTAAVAATGTSDGNVPVYASGALNLADKLLQRAQFKDISEDVQTVAAASTTSIDIESGNVVILTQDTNITTFNFNNPAASGDYGPLTIIRVKDNSGTTRSIAWPAAVDWPNGVAPSLTQTANAVDIFVFFTLDAGTRWHGAQVSKDSK